MTHRNSTKLRRQCFDYWAYDTEHGKRLKCAMCTIEIHPVSQVWEADHLITRAYGGSDEPPNVRPLCKVCHLAKTAKVDIPCIAKGKRVKDRTYGIRRTAKPMPGSKASGWRHKMDGSWERRDE